MALQSLMTLWPHMALQLHTALHLHMVLQPLVAHGLVLRRMAQVVQLS
ncbi:hypothetical protein CIB84_014623 [Bambusicola thoracicus]|uniref:Uncharacterized protein n=1 Tax=Bambusicola thoracicus TaxID=9083 RepID=A0A2P4SBY8_BAMTH|nr:hypothetical protein CIB84_014623 [Bambusicola thoracicus]